MWLIFLSFLLFIGLFVVGLRWGVVVIGKILGRVVNDRHQNAEFIINTGQVPEQWTSEFYKKIDEINKSAGTNDLEKRKRVSSLESKAKRYSIKRINDLLKYFSRAPVFSDDYSRKVLMDQLQAAKKEWLKYIK